MKRATDPKRDASHLRPRPRAGDMGRGLGPKAAVQVFVDFFRNCVMNSSVRWWGPANFVPP